MRHMEVHYIYISTDARNAEYVGLIDFEITEYCEHCSEQVAFVEDGFEQCSVVIDDYTTFLLCSVCSLPILNPGTRL